MSRLCECGCGQEVDYGDNFIDGHSRYAYGKHSRWNGGKTVFDRGYVGVRCYGHHRANYNGYVKEHVLVMEKALGRRILSGEHIHHIDGNTANNKVGNLIVFATKSMHHAFEGRLRAFKESGHYAWRQCRYCHRWDDPDNLVIRGGYKGGAFHRNRRTNPDCCGD